MEAILSSAMPHLLSATLQGAHCRGRRGTVDSEDRAGSKASKMFFYKSGEDCGLLKHLTFCSPLYFRTTQSQSGKEKEGRWNFCSISSLVCLTLNLHESMVEVGIEKGIL